MIVKFAQIPSYSTEKVRIFSVYLGENKSTEYDYFFDREENLSESHKEEMDIIFSTIERIMYHTGAKRWYFIVEKLAHYLPNVPDKIKDKNKIDWGIRLYCIYLRDDLLILLNGDIKTTLDPLKCKNVKNHFLNAERIASGIQKALVNKELDFNEPDPFKDFTLNI